MRFPSSNEVPIFNRPSSQIAKDYADFQKERAEAGQIAQHRYEAIVSFIKAQLNPYVGPIQNQPDRPRPMGTLFPLAAEEREGPQRPRQRRHDPHRDVDFSGD